MAFGSGVVTWEYIEGIRSWLLPGILAAIMRATNAIDGRPLTYVYLIRILCSALSLVVPLLAFKLVRRRYGLAAAFAAGMICALWYDLVYYSPVILTEVLSAHCALLALLIGDSAGKHAERRAFAAGLLYGLGACPRFQYAPAIALLAFMQFRASRRGLVQTALGAAMVLIVVLGGLGLGDLGHTVPVDLAQLSAQRHGRDAAAMGTEPGTIRSISSWLTGDRSPGAARSDCARAPQAAGLALATGSRYCCTRSHPTRRSRFIYFAIAAAPILIGLGLAEALRRLKLRPAAISVAAPVTAALIIGAEALTASTGATGPDAWHRDAATINAFVQAGQVAGLCGAAVRSLHITRTGGYTYLHRDVPLYFETPTMAVSNLPRAGCRFGWN